MNLDIIIPAYNEADNLNRLLPFLISNSPVNKVKIYIVDASKSSDDTESICNQDQVNYIRSSNTQRSRQLNEGAQASSGEYLFFLHADVQPPQEFYDLIKDSFNQGIEAGCFAYKFDSNKTLLKLNSFFSRFKGIFTGGGDQGLFISRKEFLQLGSYCEQHNIMEDFDFYKKIRKENIPFKVIKKEATVSSRKYENNSWLKVNVINLIALVGYKINLDTNKISDFYQRRIRN